MDGTPVRRGDRREIDPTAGFAPASAGLQNRCLDEIGHRGVLEEKVFPAGVAPAAFRFVNGRASVAARERESVVRYAGAAPALSGWKPDVLAVTPIPRMIRNGRQSWNCTGLVASSARCSSV